MYGKNRKKCNSTDYWPFDAYTLPLLPTQSHCHLHYRIYTLKRHCRGYTLSLTYTYNDNYYCSKSSESVDMFRCGSGLVAPQLRPSPPGSWVRTSLGAVWENTFSRSMWYVNVPFMLHLRRTCSYTSIYNYLTTPQAPWLQFLQYLESGCHEFLYFSPFRFQESCMYVRLPSLCYTLPLCEGPGC